MYENLTSHYSKTLVKDKTCFKNPQNPRCADIFITNSTGSFQKTAVTNGLSKFLKMIVTVCKTSFQISTPKEVFTETTKILTKTHLKTF